MSEYSAVPQQLKDLPNWVVWREEKRNGKKTKVPYDANTHDFAKTNDSTTWASFSRAAEVSQILNAHNYDGVGFMLKDSDLTGVDFDGVVDDGVPELYVLNLISQIGTPYCEVTPSGTGLRVFIKGNQLPPGNRKFSAKKKGVEKYGAEIYSGREGGRYLTISGDHYSGEGIPKIENIDIIYFLISKFADEHFRRLWMGDASEYENDDSRVDLALMGVFARAFNGDVPKMLRFFNASVPGHREKWIKRPDDYQKMTIAKATSGLSMSSKAWDKFVEQPRKIIEFHEFPEEKQKSEWTAFDYVIQAIDGQFDGWFPLGSPSLVGGSSGSGKTTFMLDLCVAQAMGAPFYKHVTFKRPYLVLMLDRGADSHTRTMRRLGFKAEQVPIKFLKAAVDGEASQQIVDMIEQTTPPPQVIFIEGIDMLVSDPNSLDVVMPFMHEIQQIASHFHVAIIGSCGAPKTKPKEGYAAKRDTIFGSAVWSRMSETIVTIQYPAGDDTADKREITILPRNAKAEQFTTEFQDGRLVAVLPTAESEAHPGGRPNEPLQAAIQFLERELQAGPQPGKTLLRNAHDLENISRTTLYRAAKDLHIIIGEKIAGTPCWRLPEMQGVMAHDNPYDPGTLAMEFDEENS
jgi:AAA domain